MKDPSIFKDNPFYSIPLTNEAFFKSFFEIINEEFTLQNSKQLLKIISFEVVIEEKFVEFLIDYKASYDKLKKPFIKQEYTDFILKKEATLKLFFKYLKEYISTCAKTIYEPFYLIQIYENCSICDILSITGDFSLKFDILFTLSKFPGSKFYLSDPQNPTKSHFNNLFDFLSLYGDIEELLWADFWKKQGPLEIIKKEIFLVFDEKSNFLRLDIEKTKNKLILNLNEEIENSSKKIQENNDMFRSPSNFVYFIEEKIKISHPEVKVEVKLTEEIKLIVDLFYLNDNDNSKNNLIYFYFITFLCDNIMNSSKSYIFNYIYFICLDRGVDLKRLLSRNYNKKIMANSFLCDLSHFITNNFVDEFILFDYLLILNFANNFESVYNEQFRNSQDFGKFEKKTLDLIENFNFSNFSDSNFKANEADIYAQYSRKFLVIFIEIAEKSIFLSEKKFDIKSLNLSIQRYQSYIEKNMEPIFDNPQLLLTHKKFYYFFLGNMVNPLRNYREPTEKLYKLMEKFFKILFDLADNNSIKSENEMHSLGKLIQAIFDNLITDDNALRKLGFCENLVKNGTMKNLEDLIIYKNSILALMIYNKILFMYFNLDPLFNQFRKTIGHDRLMTLSETVFFKMQNLEFDVGSFLKPILRCCQDDRFLKYYLTRYFILKLNKIVYGSEDIVTYTSINVVFRHFETIAQENEKNLKIHLENERKIFFSALEEQNPRKIKIINEYFKQINSTLFHNTLELTTSLTKNEKINEFSHSFSVCMIRTLISLFDPLNNQKGEENILNLKLIEFVNLKILIRESDGKVLTFIDLMTNFAAEKIDFLEKSKIYKKCKKKHHL